MKHESTKATTDTWLTPPAILRPLGPFDLDPCTPLVMPWTTAAHRYTVKDDGLAQPWFGRVWLNPPYGKVIGQWLRRLSEHGNGIALVFARTETDWFHRWVWEHAAGALFLEGRITFIKPNGQPGASNAGAPSCLVAYGMNNAECLEAEPVAGRYLPINYRHVIVVGVSSRWFDVVSIAVRAHGDEDLQPVYDMVERMAPDKINLNRHWKAKVRQQVQAWRRQNKSTQQSLLKN